MESVNVSLDRSALGSCSRPAAATIETSKETTESPVAKNFNDRVVDVEDHSSDDDITNSAEPLRIEIRKGASCQSKGNWLFR